MAGAKYFSSLDLASEYWQIKVHPESQQKTAFITHCGLHGFKVGHWFEECTYSISATPAASASWSQSDWRGEFVSVYLQMIL